ncbi:MAG: acyl-ACP thioesterase domain-containing protein [Balneolaceae bacterium]
MQKNNQAVFRQSFTVRSYEVASDQKATLPSVCDYFQEAAGVHAQQLDFDISQLQEQNLTWVLYKMHVKMNRFPERWNEIEVETWPSSGDGIRAFRDYELKDSRGTILGAAISQWMVLNIKTRRPVRMPQAVLDMGINTSRHVIEIDKKPVEPVKKQNHRFLLSVGEYDLDMNNHVNNVSYIRWITGFRPAGITAGKKCTEINIQYVSEAVLGDEIYQATEPVEDSAGHYRQTLYKNNDFKVIAAAVTKWDE